ncbi:hypothetical protein [Ruminiclostridium cellobioparum]|uniref:hypothetical protein n=1 Tax=Ruminiclostridium cellobioparum TaxID=29355 RepID=UPI0028A61694|nr:hypothetical protein [Ruminiclostridium cellobioparum]
MISTSSLTGIHKEESYSIEVTMMDATEYPLPLNSYIIFDIVVRCQDRQQCYDVKDFTFYLMTAEKIYNGIEVTQVVELNKYIKDLDTYQTFNGRAVVGFCEHQHITMLFEHIEAVFYRESAILFRYKSNNQLSVISLIH